MRNWHAKPWAEHTNNVVKIINSLYLPVEDVLTEPGKIEASRRIKDRLQINKIRRFFDEPKLKVKF